MSAPGRSQARIPQRLVRRAIGGVALALLCAALPAQAAEFPPALAHDAPGLQPVVGLQHTCSSNLFGLRSGAAAQRLFGDPQLSDCWTAAQGGVRFDNDGEVGRLHGHALIERTQYRHYRVLNFTGHDVLLAYTLNHAPQWSLYASASDRSAQQNLAILQAPLPDLVRRQVLAVGGARRIAGPFDMTADAAFIRVANGAVSQRPYDTRIDLVRLGPRYTSAAGNSIGYVLTLLQGRYPHAALQTGNAPLADYRQVENGAQFNWSDDAFWQVSGTAGYLRYTAPSLPALNFSGVVADMQAKLAVSDKTALGLTLYRKLAAYNTPTTNYQVITGAQLSATWTVDAAVRLQADFTHDTAIFPGTSRRDRIQGGGLTVAYLPRPGTQLALRYARSSRSSNALDESYSNNILSLSLQQAF
ncbi:MAG: outer membrane beta-barrel protein [Burkholderiaceae bacterium]|nr:outer membrane beta-barrel protein [Burkholderiaceae bacterium]